MNGPANEESPTPRSHRRTNGAGSAKHVDKRAKFVELPPRVDAAQRAKWRSVVELRWSNCMHDLDILEQAFANKVRYGKGVLPADGPEILGHLRRRLDELEETFERGSRKPNVRLPD